MMMASLIHRSSKNVRSFSFSVKTTESLSVLLVVHLKNRLLLEKSIRPSGVDSFPVKNPAEPEDTTIAHVSATDQETTKLAALPSWRDGTFTSQRGAIRQLQGAGGGFLSPTPTATITPWNFPAAIITRGFGQTSATGWTKWGSGSEENEDELWEEAFSKMDEQEPLFQKLPETEEDARKVFEKCDDKSYVGPIVLVKGVPLDIFGDWLRRSELGLHKAERLANGTVYIPQACAPDHGILRQFLGNPQGFPILDRRNLSYLKAGSGTLGSQNPDVFWFRSGELTEQSRVLFEVGISQSLPDLRRRAYALCSARTEWESLAYVVLVKRYPSRRVYVEIWKRIAAQPGKEPPDFRFEQRDPRVLDVTETMEFVANAHAFEEPQGERNDSDILSWQFDLPASCDIPASDNLLVGGTAVTFHAQTFLDECQYRDRLK